MHKPKVSLIIVEDSKTIQNSIQKTLGFINYESTLTKNGLEALEKVKQQTFDAILLDIEMPVMDGISCIQAMRTFLNSKGLKTPIIAVTGNALELSKKELDQLGFTDIITKPINFSKLNNVLKKHLGSLQEKNS